MYRPHPRSGRYLRIAFARAMGSSISGCVSPARSSVSRGSIPAGRCARPRFERAPALSSHARVCVLRVSAPESSQQGQGFPAVLVGARGHRVGRQRSGGVLDRAAHGLDRIAFPPAFQVGLLRPRDHPGDEGDSGNDDGGRGRAILFTLVQECKRVGVNAWEYLRDVLMRVSTIATSAIADPLRLPAARTRPVPCPVPVRVFPETSSFAGRLRSSSGALRADILHRPIERELRACA